MKKTIALKPRDRKEDLTIIDKFLKSVDRIVVFTKPGKNGYIKTYILEAYWEDSYKAEGRLSI